uniref:Uncharacterized protein n=1 Tax=Gongylonema pulchrum TaxID=637853 RepID=A0A183DCC0_9BILA
LRPRHSFQFQLRTYSVGASSSLYNALPPPNSQISTDATSYHHSANASRSEGSSVFADASAAAINTNPRKFYAPPPSAASLSTYGVVKPAGMRLHVDRHRQSSASSNNTGPSKSRRKLRHRARLAADHSPPPSYSQVTVTRPVYVDPGMECSEEESRQLRAPTNSRIVSSIDSSSQEGTKQVLLSSIRRNKPRKQRVLACPSSSSEISVNFQQ